MATEIIVRPFLDADEARVVTLWIESGLTRPWNDPHQDIARKRGHGDDLFLVALVGEELVGTIMGGYDGHRGWVNYLAVASAWRRHGLGERLMREVELRLLECGCAKLNLQVRSDNHEAIRFYESVGYSIDAVTSFGKRLIRDVVESNAP